MEDLYYVPASLSDIHQCLRRVHTKRQTVLKLTSQLVKRPTDNLLFELVMTFVEGIREEIRHTSIMPLLAIVGDLQRVVAAQRKLSAQFSGDLNVVLNLTLAITEQTIAVAARRRSLTALQMQALLSALDPLIRMQGKMTGSISAKVVTRLKKLLDRLEGAGRYGGLKIESSDELSDFEQLGHQIEVKRAAWTGRTDFIWKIACGLNEHAGNVVEEKQLKAAVFVHDAGLVCLPGQAKEDRINAAEVVKNHPQLGANFLDGYSGWERARDIVLQHHECHDGSGFPYGVKGGAIDPGAQIIAVSDVFFDETRKARHLGARQSLIRATRKINQERGSQFEPRWVDSLNVCVTKLI